MYTDSGMKEDLSLYGRELNYANAIWSAAYVFGQIPSNLLLTRVSTSFSRGAPLYTDAISRSMLRFTLPFSSYRGQSSHLPPLVSTLSSNSMSFDSCMSFLIGVVPQL